MKYPEIKVIARSLRKQQTQSEKIFWQEFRNRKFHNLKFDRQFPIIYQTNSNEHYFYIADFYCFQKKLVVELDGQIHDYQKEKDYNRDKVIEGHVLIVLRIKNGELENMEGLKQKILEFVGES